MRLIPHWARKRIALKLIGGTLLILVSVMVISSVRAIDEERRVHLEQMDTQGTMLSEMVSNSCVEPLLIQDYPVLETLAELLAQEENGISFVRIERRDSSIVAEAPSGSAEDPKVRSSSRTYTSDIKAGPDNPEIIGRIVLGISTKCADDLITSRVWSLIRDSAISFVVITVLMLMLLKRTVANPLRRLDAQAHSLGQGDLDTIIALPSVDELGRLAGTLDKMRVNLKTSYEQIQEQNVQLAEHRDHLEELVEDRTAELAETNRQLQSEITERKEKEEALRESEQRFRTIFDNATDGILLADPENKGFFMGNRMICQMLGYDQEEIRNLGVMDIHPREDLPYVTEQFEKQSRGEITVAENIPVERKDGSAFYADVKSSAITLSGRTYLMSIFRDITERKQAEEEKDKLEGQLGQAQKMEVVGQLAGGVAHDFNNILQAIQGYTQLAMQSLSPGEGCYEDLAEVRKAAKRAAGLTRQLLIFSRREVVQPKDLDLNELIDNLMKMLNRVIGEDIELEIAAGQNLGPIHADAGQMEQILMNLCVNARDAMREGGKITIETENVLISGHYCRNHPWAREGRYVLLMVSDTGIGMPPDVQEHIFEPFFTTKEEGEGTGLGLATVYGIVKRHGGCIDVYSEVDKGTTFKIYLPMVERRAACAGQKIGGPVPGGAETILVAEDEEAVRDVVVRILGKAGYTVLTASDGEEAVAVFESESERIDLILLDVIMPKLNGRAVHVRIKALEPDTPVLFSSGYSSKLIDADFFLAERVELIQKPYSPDDLLRKVRELLDGAQEKEEKRAATSLSSRE